MQLLEFQAKELFREYGINLLDSKSSTNIEEGRKHAKELGYPFVIKIQVPVGGRGKAGGIQACHNDDEFELKYPQVMDLTIKGEKARAILLEKMADIKKELYLSLFLNRSKRCYTIIASAEGGVEIESVKSFSEAIDTIDQQQQQTLIVEEIVPREKKNEPFLWLAMMTMLILVLAQFYTAWGVRKAHE